MESTFAPGERMLLGGLSTPGGVGVQENKLDHHEHLYQEALQRRERAVQYRQWIPEDCTFHPQISGRHSAPSDFGLSLLERCDASHASMQSCALRSGGITKEIANCMPKYYTIP